MLGTVLYYSANSGHPDSTSSYLWPWACLLLGRRSGVATSPSERDARHSQPGAWTSPPRGVQDLHMFSGPPGVHASAPSRGSGTAACPAATGVLKTLTRRAHGTPHLENCMPYSDDHSARRGWQDAGAISARPRMMARSTTTPDAKPHSVLPTVIRPLHPRNSGEDDDFRVPYSCTPPLLVTIKGGCMLL